MPKSDIDRIDSSPFIPPRASSIGNVTDLSTSSGTNAGANVFTWT
jgi:hypothetical protein